MYPYCKAGSLHCSGAVFSWLQWGLLLSLGCSVVVERQQIEKPRKQTAVDGRKPSAPESLLITRRAIVDLSCKRRQCRQAGRQRKKKRAGGRGREGAGWLQEERGGENGWGSACMSTSAPTAGLGNSAAVSVLVLGVLTGPGSWGKRLIHHYRFPPQVPFRIILGASLWWVQLFRCDLWSLSGRPKFCLLYWTTTSVYVEIWDSA